MEKLDLASRIEDYDPKQSADNRFDEIELHRDIVLETGIGGMNPDFEHTFLRSLDAAMTLVPEGFEWCLYSDASCEIGPEPDYGCIMVSNHTAEAATPTISLCAAALRARDGQ